MSKKTNDAISRSDRVLVAALAIILATASAAIGTSLTYHPSTDKPVAVKPVLQVAEAHPSGIVPAADAVMTQLLAEHKCLSEALYYEARGEGAGGQKAVAEVVFHRMNRGDYGHSICAVVYEGSKRPGCQFSFTCNGDMKRAKQPAAWRQAETLAAQILTGQVSLKNATGGALNYHAVSVAPDWAETMDKTTQIGNHVFYRGAPHATRDS
ncbi:MAG TPA: cell wall hydrolase [Rhizomicrobium sp.]|nr:cell wall hydrolase [Rhizomicrobium sp.]